MKYIRTKDGVYEVKVNKYHELVYKKDNQIILSKDIINQADTIEDLCDEFRYDVNEYVKHEQCYFSTIGKVWVDRSTYEFLTSKQISTIKGAIWTDEGLIYVAKMNDKGELKLI